MTGGKGLLQIVTGREEISRLHGDFCAEIHRKLSGLDRRILSIRFARTPREVMHDDEFYFTWNILSGDRGTERYRNVFGVFSRGDAADALPVSVQINIPCAGSHPKVAGFFARDLVGNPWLMHSGKLGGNSPGIKKDALHAEAVAADFEVSDIKDGTAFRRALRVAPVSEGRMVAPLFRFVRLVELCRRSKDDVIG